MTEKITQSFTPGSDPLATSEYYDVTTCNIPGY